MSLEKTNVVDAIGVEKATGDVILTIADPLDWTDERGHLLRLQDKINRYLGFIESGEMVEAYPLAKDKNAVIEVAVRCPLPEIAVRFLERAREVAEGYGVGFRFGIR